MGLVTCPDCGREVSDRAASCPQCGAPIAAATSGQEPQRVITTEDSALTRNRGCGDIAIYGCLGFVILVILLALLACNDTSATGEQAPIGPTAPHLPTGEFVLDSVEGRPFVAIQSPRYSYEGWLEEAGVASSCTQGVAVDTTILWNRSSLTIQSDSTFELVLDHVTGRCYSDGLAWSLFESGGIRTGTVSHIPRSVSDTFLLEGTTGGEWPLVVNQGPPVKLAISSIGWLWFDTP